MKQKQTKVENGTVRDIEDKKCVYYDGYWIRYYEYQDSLVEKKRIIDVLTRRVFRHVEFGINTPGKELELIRDLYQREKDPARKRVKQAMYAGACLNRARDILTRIVELEELGVTIAPDSELLSLCNECFSEALKNGKCIRLRSGEEGLDELWGEPFRAFTTPADTFYQARYIKLAKTMQKIEEMAALMERIINRLQLDEVALQELHELRDSARDATETMRSDPLIFEVWPRFIVARETFERMNWNFPEKISSPRMNKGMELLQDGCHILSLLTTIRVDMPASIAEYIEKSEIFFTIQ